MPERQLLFAMYLYDQFPRFKKKEKKKTSATAWPCNIVQGTLLVFYLVKKRNISFARSHKYWAG